MNDKINQIICFDVETGGLDQKTQKHALKVPITQFACHVFRADTFEMIEEYETFVKPYAGLEYQQQALNFTGISMADINGGIDVEHFVNKFTKIIANATTGNKRYHKPVLLGHNIGYDIQFIQYAFNHVGKSHLLEALHGSFDGYGNFQPAYYDTMWMSRNAWVADNDGKKFTLGDCCERAGVNLVEAHSALPDVRATVELYQFLTKRAREQAEVAEPQDMGSALAHKPKQRETFRFQMQ